MLDEEYRQQALDIYTAHRKEMLGVAGNTLRRCPNVDRYVLAEDVVQDTVIKILERPVAENELPVRDFRAYFVTCVRNTALDTLRKLRCRGMTDHQTTNECDDLETKQRDIDRSIDHRTTMEYLRGLAGGLANEVHREAILAHCFEDEPLETMAQRTGIPVGTLKSGCYRAKRTLIDTLKRKGTFDEYNALNT